MKFPVTTGSKYLRTINVLYLVPLGNQFIVYIVIWIGSLFLSGRQYLTL